jgi:hypothetical protein
LNLYRFVTLEIHEFSNIEDIFETCKGWVNDFLALGSLGRKGVTPYMHCLAISNVLSFSELVRHRPLRPICLFLNDDFVYIIIDLFYALPTET